MDEQGLLRQLLASSDRERAAAAKRQTAELAKAQKRKAEVDKLFAKMYEEWAAERITEASFTMLSQKYQAEQQELESKIQVLTVQLAEEREIASNAEKRFALIRRYTAPTELNAELLNTLIEKIVIHEATKGEDGMREQEIDWTKAWSRKYPILASYRSEVDTEMYGAELKRLLDDLQKRYGYDELNALLVLKDILASVWKTEKKQSKRKNKRG